MIGPRSRGEGEGERDPGAEGAGVDRGGWAGWGNGLFLLSSINPRVWGKKSVKKLRRFLFLCRCRCLVTFVVVDDDGLQPLTANESSICTEHSEEDCLGLPHITMFSILASRSAALGSILGVPNFFQKKNLMLSRFIDHTLFRQRIVQSLIVDETHLVLVSGKLVLQKEVSLIDSRSV